MLTVVVHFLKKLSGLTIVFILLFVSGCDGFFGKRTDSDFLDVPVYDDQTLAYVPIQPALTGFSRPVDVIAGWDELIYVVDESSSEIVSFDQAGNELGRKMVPGVHSIAQDRRFDILALGRKDTVINGTPFSLATAYRLDLNKSGPYGIQHASIESEIIHPFYFKSGTPTMKEEDVSFEGVAILSDNRFYIARRGPNNSTNQFGGPDDAILVFNDEDEYVTPVFVKTELGLFTNYFRKPASITSFAMPPQSNDVDRTGHFIFTSVDVDFVLKVQGIEFRESEFGSSYEVRSYAVGDTSRADGFLYEPGRFTRPVDVSVAGDGTGFIFVVDAATDSLYQFSGLGFEGVSLQSGNANDKATRVSFGGTGEELTQFREPMGVAYLNKIVYVADAGNGRVLRFKLTTDFE